MAKFKVSGFYETRMYVEFEVEADSLEEVESREDRLLDRAHEEAYRHNFETDSEEFDCDSILEVEDTTATEAKS